MKEPAVFGLEVGHSEAVEGRFRVGYGQFAELEPGLQCGRVDSRADGGGGLRASGDGSFWQVGVADFNFDKGRVEAEGVCRVLRDDSVGPVPRSRSLCRRRPSAQGGCGLSRSLQSGWLG